MRYLHTMLRVENLQESLAFYKDVLQMQEIRRHENEKGRFTLVFLAAKLDVSRAELERAPILELTYNWDRETYHGGRNFGHLAFEVEDIYAFCKRLMEQGLVINRPPRDGNMAFIRSPEGISIELLQKGAPLAPQEPWLSMQNSGTW